jgi:hypothetical protein
MYALIQNGAVIQFPYTVDQLKQDNPQTSFPASMTPETLAGFGMVPVVSTGYQFDPASEVAEPNGCTYNADKQRWETAWTARPKTAEELQADTAKLQQAIVAATQQRLDDFARTRNYDGILSLCTYSTSTVPKFATEGQYAVEARDATWAKLYSILDEVNAGTRPITSGFSAIESELPVLVWP